MQRRGWLAPVVSSAQPHQAYARIVLLALVPQLLGHGSLAWALGSLPAALVAVAPLGQPVGRR